MIIGDQVRFRAIEKEDLPYFVKWLNDPDVQSGLSLYLPLSLAEEEKWFEEILKRDANERPVAIEIQPDPNINEWIFVGNCGLFGIDWQNRYAEVGIHIGEKDFWDQGFGTRAMKLLNDVFAKKGFRPDARRWLEHVLEIDPYDADARRSLDTLTEDEPGGLVALKPKAPPADWL